MSIGTLLPIYSVKSDQKWGSFGSPAYKFVDWLAETEQSYWQILPIYKQSMEDDSPYSVTSSFAGNVFYIDYCILLEHGLINNNIYQQILHYAQSKSSKENILFFKKVIFPAIFNQFDKENEYYLQFCKQNSWWLYDYAVFETLYDYFEYMPMCKWPKWAKDHSCQRMQEFIAKQSNKIEIIKVMQFLFYDQFFKLKKYANEKDIKIIGDIPFFSDSTSADLWQNQIGSSVGCVDKFQIK